MNSISPLFFRLDIRNSKMNIFFFPPTSHPNKYVDNLRAGLQKEGIYILNSKQNFIIMLFEALLLRFFKNVRIFHLNWILNLASDTRIKNHLATYVFIAWIRILKLTGGRLVWTIHNIIPHECKNESLVIHLRNILIKNCDRIIIHSKESIKILHNVLSKQLIDKVVHYIPHGHYIDDYIKTDNNCRETLNIADDEFVFLFLGLIREYKNIDLLIRVFNDLQLERAKLLICGKFASPVLQEKIVELAKPNHNIILIQRFLDDDEVVQYFNTADIMVLPFDNSSTLNSASIYMALSLKTPAITPVIGTTKDIGPKPFLFTYEYKNSSQHYAALKAAIRKSFQFAQYNKKRFAKLGFEGYEHLKINNDWTESITQLSAIYRDLVND